MNQEMDFNRFIDKAMDYSSYIELIHSLHQKEQSTSFSTDLDLFHYSKLNLKRMQRIEKTYTIEVDQQQKIVSIGSPVVVLVLTESWCGDAAQVVPMVDKICTLNKNLKLKLLLRDQNLELMDRFLTLGSRSIPKILFVDPLKNKLIDSWGARPDGAKQLIIDYKEQHGVLDTQAKTDLQKWYNKDKGRQIVEELVGKLL